jgi:hypothetical protein
MKRLAFRLTVFTLFLAAVVTWSAVSHAAEDTAKAPATSPTTQPGPSKFYGTITAVDAKAATFTVDGQTFNVVADTHLTKAADGSAATIADAVVGETARGTYTTTSDGKLNVTKVRFGKKTGGSGGGKKGKAAATQKSE